MPQVFASPFHLFRRAAESSGGLADAYAVCERLAFAHYENFPVASWLLPRDMRPHVAAVYAFARTADDFADEGDRSPQERQRLLDEWRARLRSCTSLQTAPPTIHSPAVSDRIFEALGHTIQTRRLPRSLFEDLLSAFRQDTTTHRYETWTDLLDYCRRSANPVGRIVLRIAGVVRDDLDRSSDALCTALQLTNFWQDLERDWTRGRLYLPRDLLVVCGAREEQMNQARLDSAWTCALQEAVSRTRALFTRGRLVCDAVGGRLGLELRLTWIGGTTILDRLQRSGFDVFAARPSLHARDALPLLWKAVWWSSR